MELSGSGREIKEHPTAFVEVEQAVSELLFVV